MTVQALPVISAEHTSHAEHLDEVAAPLHVVLRKRLLNVVTLRGDLRLIVGLAVAQLLAAAILVALKNESGGIFEPTVYAFPAAEGNGLQLISQAAFLIGLGLTIAAWALLLAGAFRAGVGVRLVVFGFFFSAMASERDALYNLDAGTHIAVYLLIAAIAVLGVVTWPPEHRRSVVGTPPGPIYARVRSVLPLVLFLLVGSIYAAVFLSSHAADAGQAFASRGDTQVSTFTNDVFDQLNNIQYLLIPILVLAGADFGDWGQLAIARTARRLRGAVPVSLFAAIAVLACAAIAYDGITVALSSDGGGLAELAFAGIVFAFAALLYVLARPRGAWSPAVPFAAVATVAILDTAVGFVVEATQGSTSHLTDYIILASAALWVVGGCIALGVLLARRGTLSPGWVTALVFVVLVGVTDVLGSMFVLGNLDNPPLGITSDNPPYLGAEGLRAAAALLTVATLIVAVVVRRLRQWMLPIMAMLIATVTIEVLSYIDLMYAHRGKLEELGASGGIAIGGAVILILALLFELAVSGEAITNVTGRIFPRDTRLLSFLGYVLLVAASVLLFASLHDESGKLLPSTFDPEEWVKEGILFLGIPLVITFCIAAMHRLRPSALAERTQPPQPPPPHAPTVTAPRAELS